MKYITSLFAAALLSTGCSDIAVQPAESRGLPSKGIDLGVPTPAPDPGSVSCVNSSTLGAEFARAMTGAFNFGYLMIPTCSVFTHPADAACKRLIGTARNAEVGMTGDLKLRSPANSCRLQISGQSPCNSYFGDFSINAAYAGSVQSQSVTGIAVTPKGGVGATEMGCEQRRTDLQTVLLDTIGRVSRIEFWSKTGSLGEYVWLYTQDGRVIKTGR